jgi:septation ring formation regulator EzrA
MATKKILFQVEIEGSEQIIRTQKQLAEAIKATNEQLKQTELGTEEYRKLEAELGKLKNAQKDVADSQKAVQRELEVQASGGARTYRALNAELVNLRSLYKELTEVERNSQIGVEMRKQIQLLDAELKDIDASIGQFQRNVGNYSQAFEPLKGLLSSSVPGFSQLAGAADAARTGIGQVGQAATLSGKAITSMFVGFQAISLILEGVQAIREFAAETNKLRGEIQRLGNETTEQAAAATSKIIALGNTFKADQEELLKATNAVAQNFGISYD